MHVTRKIDLEDAFSTNALTLGVEQVPAASACRHLDLPVVPRLIAVGASGSSRSG
jgi:hypothetical protein